MHRKIALAKSEQADGLSLLLHSMSGARLGGETSDDLGYAFRGYPTKRTNCTGLREGLAPCSGESSRLRPLT